MSTCHRTLQSKVDIWDIENNLTEDGTVTLETRELRVHT